MSRIRTLPDLAIELNGARLIAERFRPLISVRVQQRLSQPTLCELRFAELPQNRPDFSPGMALRVTLQDHTDPLFEGQVTATEFVHGPAGEFELHVRAYDRLHQLRKRQTVRAFTRLNLHDLARELTADLGVEVQADDAGPTTQQLLQYRHSDFDLLVDTAERYGYYWTLRGDVLHLTTLKGVGPRVTLELGRSLFEARFEVNSDSACEFVSASGWDLSRGEHHQGEASEARVGREVGMDVSPYEVGGSGELFLGGQAVQDSTQAQAVAQGELDGRVAREVLLEGVAEGDPKLRPGALVDTRGVTAGLEGLYVLTAVNHLCDAEHGYVCEIDTSPPPRRNRSHAAGIDLGVVTRVDDPDNLGRVRVSLPAFNNIESEWLCTLAAGGGRGKGLVMVPDVGDTVVVLFLQENPAQAMIIGGLYGAHGAPDPGVEGTAVRRYTFMTPGGQRISLDDAQQVVRIQNSDGSFIELAPKKVRLSAHADLEIEAPGRSVVIRGKFIDFVRG